MVSATAPNCACDCAVNPVPVTVVEKIPSGKGDVPIDNTVGGTFVSSVTVAVVWPAAFDAVTVSVPDAGIDAGAVYRPAGVTVPATAVQLVAPADLNC